MLQLPIMALFLRTIPEGILVVLVCYMILGKDREKTSILLSGTILGISTYIIRMLPIYFGIHITLILMVCIFLLYKLNHIEFYSAITVSISSFILLMVSEWITIVVYVFVFKVDTKLLSQPTLQGILMGVPSLVILLLAGMLIGYLKKRNGGQ